MAARVQTARDAPADDGRAPNEASRAPYVVGVMKIPVDTQDADFDAIVDGAVAALGRRLTEGKAHLTVQLSQFPGPHLTPVEGAYAPLDFLQIGVTEKLERRLDFLLIVTEVDLAATGRSYVLALPS